MGKDLLIYDDPYKEWRVEHLVSDSIANGEALRYVLQCDAVLLDFLIGVGIGIILTLISLRFAKKI